MLFVICYLLLVICYLWGGLVGEADACAAPDGGIGVEFVADGVGVEEVAVDGPLAVALGDVEEEVEGIFEGGTEVVVLEAGVFAGGAGEEGVVGDIGDIEDGSDDEAEFFEDEVVFDAGFDVPAVVEVVVVGGVDVWGEDGLVGVEEDGVVEGDFEEDFVGVFVGAVGIGIAIVAAGDDEGADAPFGAEEGSDFLEVGDGV